MLVALIAEQHLAPTELRTFLRFVIYKHFVSPGLTRRIDASPGSENLE